MKKAILGTKLGMTQLFDENGKIIPVTVVEAGPCVVVQKKTTDNDGYCAVQVGFMDKKEKHTNKPEEGHFKKAGVSAKRFLKEFKLENAAEMNVGDEIKVDAFAAGDKIDVTGTSKGHGYAGAIKRHGFSRLKETHGTGPVHRHAGSMGACSSPSRIFKGKGMPYVGYKNRGDQLVTLVVEVPTKLTKEQKELLRKFDEAADGANAKKKSFTEKVKNLFG